MRKIITNLLAIVGAVLFILGAMTMDSESMLIPVLAAITGCALLIPFIVRVNKIC